MAFVVEDGTGLANANSYVDLDFFQEYWDSRGFDLTQYTPQQKQEALVLASDHVDVFWGPKFFGYKSTSEQALEWPRLYAYDVRGCLIEGVPAELKKAVCEYAKRVVVDSVSLSPDPTSDATGLQVQSTFKKVGPLEKRIVYTTGSRRLLPAFPKADAFMAQLTWGNGGGSYRA